MDHGALQLAGNRHLEGVQHGLAGHALVVERPGTQVIAAVGQTARIQQGAVGLLCQNQLGHLRVAAHLHDPTRDFGLRHPAEHHRKIDKLGGGVFEGGCSFDGLGGGGFFSQLDGTAKAFFHQHIALGRLQGDLPFSGLLQRSTSLCIHHKLRAPHRSDGRRGDDLKLLALATLRVGMHLDTASL